MQSEYLLLCLGLIAVPAALSFERRLSYARRWKRVLLATVPVALVYLVWDIIVAGEHWQFNDHFTLAPRLLGLAISEYLYYFAVSFACLYVWELVRSLFRTRAEMPLWRTQRIVLFTLFPAVALIALASGYTYTGLVFAAAFVTVALDQLLGARVLGQYRAWQYMALVILFLFLSELFLTGRQIVLYNEDHHLNLLVVTIPAENFVYGLCYVGSVLVVYEALRRRERHRRRPV